MAPGGVAMYPTNISKSPANPWIIGTSLSMLIQGRLARCCEPNQPGWECVLVKGASM
jgi:hypothetical protein